MSDQFVAEIRIFAFNFPPNGWAFCNGQILPISQNTALFSLLGTTYGGNGANNFALPDLQGRVPIQQGEGPGLSDRFLGESEGTATVTLLESEIPVHTHDFIMEPNTGGHSPDPTNRVLGQLRVGTTTRGSYAATADTFMAPPTPVGGSQPHNNMMPYLTMNYCIALQGVFPPRQ